MKPCMMNNEELALAIGATGGMIRLSCPDTEYHRDLVAHLKALLAVQKGRAEVVFTPPSGDHTN